MLEGPIACGVAEDVAFADAAAFGGEYVADGDIANMDPVQAGVEEGGEFALQEIDNDLAGGGWFDIARANGGAGVDDDDGMIFCEFERDLFGLPFGAFVMIAHLRFGIGGGFVGWGDGSIFFDSKADATDGAGVNDARTSSGACGRENVVCAFDVGGIHGRVVAQPEVITGGDVAAPIAVLQAAAEGGFVEDVVFDHLVIGAGEAATIAIGAQK